MTYGDLTPDLFDTAPPRPAARPSLVARAKGAVITGASDLLLPALRRVAGDQIGGETLDDAWRVADRLSREGLGYSLGFWDTPAYGPAEVADIYRAAIDRAGAHGGGYVSIKPPALRFDHGLADELSKAAAKAGVRLHADSHGEAVADLTFAFTRAMLANLSPELVSVSIPGRWRRSLADARGLLDQGVGVRIVKGEWPDPAEPARDLREGFLEAARGLAGRTGRIALATHDLPLMTAAAGALSETGTAFEAEFIQGLQTEAHLAFARSVGAPVNIYVPYGKGFVPSALRALRRKPALALEIAKSMISARRTGR